MTGHEVFLWFFYTGGCMLGGFLGGVAATRRVWRQVEERVDARVAAWQRRGLGRGPDG